MQWHVTTSALQESWIAPQWNDLTLINVHDVYWERWESVALGFSSSSFLSLHFNLHLKVLGGRSVLHMQHIFFLLITLVVLFCPCDFCCCFHFLSAWTWLVNFKLSKSRLFTTRTTLCLLAAWRSSVLDRELVWNAFRVSGWNSVSLALSLPTSAARTPFLRVFSHHVNTFFIPSNSKPYNFSQCQASPDPPPLPPLSPRSPFPSFILSSWPLRTWSLSDILLITLNFSTCWLVNTTNGQTQISITCKWQCINEAYNDLQNGNQQSYKHEMEKKKKKKKKTERERTKILYKMLTCVTVMAD